MSKGKTHYSIGENEPHVSLCGRFGVPGTRDTSAVTCRQCLKAVVKPNDLQWEFVGK